jgi:uncharacterized protein (TIGR00730 family)
MASKTGPRIRDDAADAAKFVQEIKQVADQLLLDRADRGDIKLMARAFVELSDALRVLARYRNHRKVTVFGSARAVPDSPRFRQAVDFGRTMAQAGYMVITGAGPGIMEAGHIGAGRDMSIGLNIRLPFEQETNLVMEDNDKLLNLNYFFTRKLLFVKETDALALFPGGFGTLDECYEVLTLVQTGKTKMMPIVMLDVPGGGYWEAWAEYQRRHLCGAGMISPEDESLFRITHSIDEAAGEITNFYRVYHSERYVRGQLVLRLQRALEDTLFQRICREFADILTGGQFRRGAAHRDEANEPHLAHLPRLIFPFDRKSFGRLRLLIDLINRDG